MAWFSVVKDNPCPVCRRPNAEHRSKWCTVSDDGEAVICPFTPVGARRYIEGAGYLHVFRNDNGKMWSSDKRVPKQATKPVPPRVVDWLALQVFYHSRVDSSDVMGLAKRLGVTCYTLYLLGVGYAGKGTWTFPMYDENDKIIGIRKRNSEGKTAVYGSRNGLFKAAGAIPDEGVVVVCEGPTDAATAMDLGCTAIGRASCNTGETMICKLLEGHEAVVVGDNDEVGIHYANKLAKRLGCPVVLPARGKDLREWSPTKEEFEQAIRKVRNEN